MEESKKIEREIKQTQTENKKLEAKLGSNQKETGGKEVENGILGVKRDTFMSLIDLMIFRENSLIQNLIGMSGESVCWINHFHFTVARTLCERHLERHIIPSKRKREREKEITIKFRNIIFKLGNDVRRSILINIPIKNTILKCIFKINKEVTKSVCFVGICTPKQVNDVMVNLLGWGKNCGGSFYFTSSFSQILCSENDSRFLKEGGIEEEEEITAVVNNKNVDKGGKMNIIRNQKRVPHTIVNIPKDGVYLGFSCYEGSNILSIVSLIRVSVLPPPFNDGMKCIAYDFFGGFEDYSFNHQDEEGKEVPNIKEYYE